MLSLVIGGARSGKSRFAQSLASGSPRVIYIATAHADDDEMAQRIARHREERPAQWTTVEAPLHLAGAIEQHAPTAGVLLVDCLTIWLSNLSWEHREASAAELEAIALREVARIATAARHCHVILVTNELGCGLVPESAVARRFRDLHGWVNQDAARAADWVYLLVAGIAVPIKQPGGGQ